jgi:uncharacterized repeat protein (TIGR01451 family)
VETTASSQSAKVGDTVSDTVQITGTGGAAVTLTWHLLGPVAAVNGSCTRLNWNGAAVLAHATINVSGDGSYKTPQSTFHADGCYTYTDALAATPTTAAVNLTAGDPNETTKVRPLIYALTLHKLVRQAANSSTYVEADTSDHNRTGLYSVGATVTWRIVVHNTGEATLTDISVSDPTTPSCATTIPTLAAGASATYDCTSTARDNLINVATATQAQHKLASSDSAQIQVSDAADASGLAYTGAGQLPLTLAIALSFLALGLVLLLAVARRRSGKYES